SATGEHADRSVARFEATAEAQRNPGSERMARLQQVQARLVLGELEGATEALVPVLSTAPEHRVRPLLQRLSEVGVAVSHFQHEPLAARMLEGITEFAGDTAVVELT